MSLGPGQSLQEPWPELDYCTMHVPLCRVVTPGVEKTIGPHTFSSWGTHCDAYPTAYFTAAAAIGMKKEEVDIFAKRLDKTFTKFKRKRVPMQEENGD